MDFVVFLIKVYFILPFLFILHKINEITVKKILLFIICKKIVLNFRFKFLLNHMLTRLSYYLGRKLLANVLEKLRIVIHRIVL